jgi:TPR repeat protein
MLRSVVFLASVICVSAINPLCAKADVQPSEEMKQVMRAQATRVQRGEKSLDEFRNALRQPAESGDPVAQFMLATLLMEQDREGAMKLMTSSAEKGCAGAAGVLAMYSFSQNSLDAEEWLRRAVDGGDAASMMMRSSFYYRGDRGHGRSLSDALAWAQLAKARSHNRGLSVGVEQFIEKLRSEMSDQQISRASVLLPELEQKYPQRAFYVCGQSTP